MHEAAVLEVADERSSTLYAPVTDVAYLLTVELVPPLIVEASHKWRNVLGLEHIDEGVAHVALVLEVDGQVEEVKRAFELLFDRLQQVKQIAQNVR